MMYVCMRESLREREREGEGEGGERERERERARARENTWMFMCEHVSTLHGLRNESLITVPTTSMVLLKFRCM